MNKDKIQQNIELFEKQKADLIKQFDEHMKRYGEYIKHQYKINPDAEMFANWFIDVHQKELRKKRRFPFTLAREYVFQFCAEYKSEFDLLYTIEPTINLNNDNPYTEKVKKVFVKYLEHMKHKISEYTYLELIDEASKILENEEVNFKIEQIAREDFKITKGNLKYLYFCIFNLNPATNMRSTLIDYVLNKFEIFNNQISETFYTKFSEKSNDVLKAEKKGLL